MKIIKITTSILEAARQGPLSTHRNKSNDNRHTDFWRFAIHPKIYRVGGLHFYVTVYFMHSDNPVGLSVVLGKNH